jgi:2-polyprenyl-3-methyl-5-hydroxy-6-metoxy-1,4-benzoquinol methylase
MTPVKRDAWNDKYASSELLWGVAPNRFVEQELRDLPPGRALDLASGEGRNAIWLAARGWRVTAVDFADVAIDKARKLAAAEGAEVDWRVDDVTEFVPDHGAFDLVLVAYLQLPPDERAVVLERIVDALAPGGTFLLVAHDRRNLTDGHGGPQVAEVLWRADEVVAALADLGDFDVASAGEVLRPVDLGEGHTVDAIDCLVRATRRAAS